MFASCSYAYMLRSGNLVVTMKIKLIALPPYACAGGNKTNHDLSEKKGESLLGLIHSWSHFMCIRLSEMLLLDICIICICRNSNMIPFTLNLNAVVACI